MDATSDRFTEQLHTLYDPVPRHSHGSSNLLEEPSLRSGAANAALDTAPSLVALAIAALHRAGPHYARRTDAFWCFCAGSWSGYRYDEAVKAASTLLSKQLSVANDVLFAADRLLEAISLLKREGDTRDAEDLMNALELFHVGVCA
ncbi:hypothetical protein BAUCODRAFT_146762 [Baudoinia panamericana UAMH 10762]|uniref:Uncharacterized protein n=1 Tax=Baudoinia panamericana (strain UAMH 10762) TaxID=717646 RepID=M2NGR6_BAUPA|nr:uncharacterized protein BAUCODRAFT_146762 [Baudoinia panamericana UAMH 10762]EMC98200.1 hypothetical protein BAUCODRAFT_146762 [Baudoinia panamericana UAMH 10762]